MCPACVANVGFIAASAASTSGMAALVVKRALLKWHAKSSSKRNSRRKNENRNHEPKIGASEVSASKLVSEAERLVARKDLLTRETKGKK